MHRKQKINHSYCGVLQRVDYWHGYTQREEVKGRAAVFVGRRWVVYRQLLGKQQFLIVSLTKAHRRINVYIFSSFLFQKLTYAITGGVAVFCKTFHYSLEYFRMYSFLILFFFFPVFLKEQSIFLLGVRCKFSL